MTVELYCQGRVLKSYCQENVKKGNDFSGLINYIKRNKNNVCMKGQ